MSGARSSSEQIEQRHDIAYIAGDLIPDCPDSSGLAGSVNSVLLLSFSVDQQALSLTGTEINEIKLNGKNTD